MPVILITFINQCQGDGKALERNIFPIIRVVSYTIYIQHRLFTRSKRIQVQFYFYVRLIFPVLQLIQVLILIHQAFIIRSVDKACTSTLCLLIQPEYNVQPEHRKIVGIEHHVFISATYPLRITPSLIRIGFTHQSRFKPGGRGRLLTLLVPYVYRPEIAGSGLQGSTGIFNVQRQVTRHSSAVPYRLSSFVSHRYLIGFLRIPPFGILYYHLPTEAGLFHIYTQWHFSIFHFELFNRYSMFRSSIQQSRAGKTDKQNR